MSLFEEPRKRADISVLYTQQGWYWWCLQCGDIGGRTEDPENLEPIIRCSRCLTRYGEVFDYLVEVRWTRYLYRYEYLPHLIFEVPLDPG